MDKTRNVTKNPVSDEEKKLLRNFVAREATGEERDSFLVKNYPYLNDKARGVFREMSATDQFRVIFDGPMKEAKDPAEILYARVKKFMDMELQLRALSKRGYEPEKSKKEPSAKMQELSQRIAHSLANPKYEEVPAHERRCSGLNQVLDQEPRPKHIEGSVKGVGGVIEAMFKKYAMKKGERLRVVNETKDLWKLEGEKTVPKCQVNSGWKWVVKGAEDETKKKAQDAAQKKAAREEDAKKKAEAKKREEQKERVKEKEKEKDEKAKGKDKAKEKEKKGKEKKKSEKGKSKKRKRSEDSESDEKSTKKARKGSSSSSKAKKKTKKKKKSSSESSWAAS